MKTNTQIRQDLSDAPDLSAVAVMDNGLTQITVSVMNLTATGAQIEVHAPTQLPPMLSLLVNGRLKSCEVIWQFTQFAGLRFLGVQAN